MRAKDHTRFDCWLFGLLTVVVFNFAIDPTPGIVAMVAPGILWVSFTFGGMLGLNRSIGVEMERGKPSRAAARARRQGDAVYFGKFLASLMFIARHGGGGLSRVRGDVRPRRCGCRASRR